MKETTAAAHVNAPSATTDSQRAGIGRRRLLLGAGGAVLAVLPWIPALERLLAPSKPRQLGPSQEELSEVLREGVGGTLPLYLPEKLPPGWRAAPLVSLEERWESRRAVFLNPALQPGRFYRLGYAGGKGLEPEHLITVTVRTRPPEAPQVRWEPSRLTTSLGRVETAAAGRYLAARLSTGDPLEVVVQGARSHHAEVLAIAASLRAI